MSQGGERLLHHLSSCTKGQTYANASFTASVTRIAFLIVSVSREEKPTVGAVFVNGLDNVVVIVAGTFSKEGLTSTGSGEGENAILLVEAQFLVIRGAQDTQH
jgi:hypothetical protein